jgi:hypothetical protein
MHGARPRPLALILLLMACESSGGAGSGSVASVGGPGKVASIGSLRGGGGVRAGGVRAIVRQDGPATVGEGLERIVVEKEVRARMSALKACYERALSRDPVAAGKLVLRWSVALDGRVQDVGLEADTLKREEATSCMSSLIQRWRFPPPSSVVAISFPLEFKAE